MRQWVAALGLTVTMSGTAQAETTAAAWLARYDAGQMKAMHELEILATYNGIAWVQATLKGSPAKFICVPGQLVLEHAQLISILRNAVKAGSVAETDPFGLALLRSLRATFPCSS